jgi:hypothetical protein
MKKLAMVAALLVGGALAGCGKGPCDNLQDICNGCKDQSKKNACNQTVTTYRSVPGSDADCQAVIDAHTYDGC